MSPWLAKIHADLLRTGTGMTAAEVQKVYGKQPCGVPVADLLAAGPFKCDSKGRFKAVEPVKAEKWSKDGPSVSRRALRASSVFGLA